MSLLFLADMPFETKEALAGMGLGAGALALIAALVVFLIILAIAVYIYSSFAYMGIAKKAKHKMPGLAWIPFVGPLIITSNIAKMHWWPILLLIGFWIPFVGWILQLVVFVFSIIWLWKTFAVIKKPEWWAILCIIPIVNLVLLGIAAWSKK
jgi:hypothetical protein